MSNINNGLVDGVRRIGAKLRELTIDGGIPGAPLGLRLRGSVQSGPPASGSWRPGDIVTDRAGALWTNTIRGTPGQWAGTSVIIPPSGDQTGIKDTAAINIVVQNQQAALLKTGTYYINNLLLDTYGAIYGTGRGTILQVVSGTTGYAIALKTPASTKQVVLRDFQLNCNQICGGIEIDNTGFTPITAFIPYDPLHTLENILVMSAEGDAYHFDNNARELRVHACVQYFASGYGFYLGPGASSDGAGCTDSHFTDCTSGTSANHGWYIADTASNNMFTSCKSFYSGYNESTGEWDTTECGFEILGAYLTFVGCSAQQNALHGFDLQSCVYTTVTGCESDTNSAGTTGGVGINTNGVTYSCVTGNTGTNNTFDTPGNQEYGIQVAGVQTNLLIYGNAVTGSTDDFNYVSGYGFQYFGADTVGMWNTSLFQSPSPTYNSYTTVQALSNSSTIDNSISTTGSNYGVYPVSSTANVTGIILQAPDNGDGTEIIITNTTAFTITFAASGTSHVAAGTSAVLQAYSSMVLVYDGTTSLWYAPGSSSGGSFTGGTLTSYLAPAVTALTDGSSVAINAALGNVFTWSLGAASHTLAAPSNPVNGQQIVIDIAYSGAYTPLFNAIYAFGADGAPTWTSTSGKTDTVAFRYSSLKSEWLCQGWKLGY